MCALYKACTGERAWKAIGDRLQAPSYLSRVDYYYIIVALFYVFLCCSMYYLFCDVPCIVCVYMCTEQLPPGGYPIAVKYISYTIIYILWCCGPTWAMASFLRFLDHTRHITVGKIPLDEWSAHRKDLYLTTHNTHNRQTSMPPVGLEPTISAGELPQIYAFDCAATGTGYNLI